MLHYFKERDLVLYAEKSTNDWRDAIKISCKKLLEHGYIEEAYVDEVVASVEEHGPYIVILPGVAIPHASPASKGIHKTAVSFTKFSEPIQFEDKENDEIKEASLFFTLVAKDGDEHMENITQLMELLSDETVMKSLLQTKNYESYDLLLSKLGG